MVKASIVDIVKIDDKYTVLLQDESGKRILPIWIGPVEGTAIAMGLRAYPTARPLTFDFITHLLQALGATLEEARIEVLKDYIFYGVAKLRIGNETREVDARPSDILALAVRTDTPVYVAEEILQKESRDIAAYEKQYRKFSPGEGVEEIMKELEDKRLEQEKLMARMISEAEEKKTSDK